MITQLATVSIYVNNQSAAEEFWTDKIGFRVLAKHDMQNGLHWVEVGPATSTARVVLYPRALMPDWNERKPSIIFECNDVDETYRELRERGVEFQSPPVQMKWGKFSTFRDPDGNEFLIKS
jgi:lactoylglutathione lyase